MTTMRCASRATRAAVGGAARASTQRLLRSRSRPLPAQLFREVVTFTAVIAVITLLVLHALVEGRASVVGQTVLLLGRGEVHGNVASLLLQLAITKPLLANQSSDLQDLLGVGQTVLGDVHLVFAHLH